MKVSIEKSELVIRLPLESPKLSPTGKTMGIASSHGNQKSGTMFKWKGTDHEIVVGVNAYFANPDRAKSE